MFEKLFSASDAFKESKMNEGPNSSAELIDICQSIKYIAKSSEYSICKYIKYDSTLDKLRELGYKVEKEYKNTYLRFYRISWRNE